MWSLSYVLSELHTLELPTFCITYCMSYNSLSYKSRTLIYWLPCATCQAITGIKFTFLFISIPVPMAPRGLQLAVTQEDPPIVSVTWQAPRQSHGNVEGYRLTYGILGESNVEERRLDGEKYRFTTAFLGKS